MGEPASSGTFPAPTGYSIGPCDGAGGPHPPGGYGIPAPRTTVARPTRVLICVGNAGVRELIGLLLADAGCAVTSLDVRPWLVGDPILGPPPEVLILDAWPLRHADAATQAHARLAAQPAAVVLLVDSPQAVQIAAHLGAIATLPLLFTLHDLVTAVQQGASAAQAADAVGHRI
jgi:hypothetical protein